jgi:flagellar basal body P-ring formation protein FlgA
MIGADSTSAKIASQALILAFSLAIVVTYPCHADAVALVAPRSVIYAGDMIPRSILERRQFRAASVGPLESYATIDAADGKIARRTLLPGQPIPLTAIRAPLTVLQGHAAKLAYEIDGVQITADGQAMESGGVGDHISVRNRQSGLVVRGRIESDRSISVARQ